MPEIAPALLVELAEIATDLRGHDDWHVLVPSKEDPETYVAVFADGSYSRWIPRASVTVGVEEVA